MKLLFAIPSLKNGGAERVVSILSSKLAEKDLEATVLVYFKTNNEYNVNNKVKKVYLCNGYEDDYNRMNYFKRLVGIRRIIKSEKPDFVIPFLPHVCIQITIALLFLKFKIIHTIRNNPTYSPKGRFQRFLRDLFISRSYKTIVQNDEQKKYFNKKIHSKIFVLPNPVREDLFQVEKKKKSDKFIIASAGRLTSQKNFKMLIDSVENICKEDDNVILRIYGEGELRDDLQNYINEKQLNKSVFLMGRTNDMKSMFESIDLYILSSDFEGMPNSLMEAMAAGVPCISTDCPTGPSDLIVDGESGLLVPVNDSIAMENAIRKMFELDMEDIGQKGREFVKKNYSPSIIVDRFIEIIER